jgi:hypothetical protein
MISVHYFAFAQEEMCARARARVCVCGWGEVGAGASASRTICTCEKKEGTSFSSVQNLNIQKQDCQTQVWFTMNDT